MVINNVLELELLILGMSANLIFKIKQAPISVNSYDTMSKWQHGTHDTMIYKLYINLAPGG